MIPFEETNIEAYRLLLRVEIVVRELLAESMRMQFGDGWRKRLPGALLVKIRDSEKEENRPQFDFLRLGPLYYLTLGELLPILRQSAGKHATSLLGGEVFVSQLENILTPRNAMAHSRDVSNSGLSCIRAIYSELEAALGRTRLADLAKAPDLGIRQQDAAERISTWFALSSSSIKRLEPQCPTEQTYELAKNQYWWGIQELAGFDCSLIHAAAELVFDYNKMPTGLGSASLRQRFVEVKRPEEVLGRAVLILKEAFRE